MEQEIKEMLEFCDEDELVEDLSLPEMEVLENAYSFELKKEAYAKLGSSPRVYDFINFCELKNLKQING